MKMETRAPTVYLCPAMHRSWFFFFFLGIDKDAETPSNCDYQRAMTITNPSHSIKYHLVEIAGTILRRLECVMAMRRERWKSKDGKDVR
jgi:hypothetical protein